MGVQAAREDVQARGVDALSARQLGLDGGDGSVEHPDVRAHHAARCHHLPALDDDVHHATSAAHRAAASIARATAASSTASPGLWLPPVLRTKSIATSVTSAMVTASCPAP